MLADAHLVGELPQQRRRGGLIHQQRFGLGRAVRRHEPWPQGCRSSSAHWKTSHTHVASAPCRTWRSPSGGPRSDSVERHRPRRLDNSVPGRQLVIAPQTGGRPVIEHVLDIVSQVGAAELRPFGTAVGVGYGIGCRHSRVTGGASGLVARSPTTRQAGRPRTPRQTAARSSPSTRRRDRSCSIRPLDDPDKAQDRR